ncbi:MAG: cupin, partial [Pseudomonadota bacterium]
YGMIMAILGGDDAGGGVIWAPQVIEEASAHGLVLAETGVLYDTKQGQALPDGVAPMPLLTGDELKEFPEPAAEEVVPGYVARYWDMMAMAGKSPCRVIGADAMLVDRPGFDVEFLTRGSIGDEAYSTPRHEVLMVMRGHWRLLWDGGETALAPGDTCAVPPDLSHALRPAMTGEASLFRVRSTDDAPGATLGFNQ